MCRFGFPRFLLPLVLLFLGVCSARAGTVFYDGFESGSLGPAWSVSSTNQGRVAVGTGYSPAVGQYAVVFDDSQIDAVYSAAQATLSLDLTNKRNVVLTFQAKSLATSPTPRPPGTSRATRRLTAFPSAWTAARPGGPRPRSRTWGPPGRPSP